MKGFHLNQISEFYEVLGHPAEYRRHETGVTLDYGLMPSVDELKVQKQLQVKAEEKRVAIDSLPLA